MKVLHTVRGLVELLLFGLQLRSGERRAVANHLSATKSSAINKLHQQGQSGRKIAEALNVDRKTVRRHLAAAAEAPADRDNPKGTGAPTGSQATPGTGRSTAVMIPRSAIESLVGSTWATNAARFSPPAQLKPAPVSDVGRESASVCNTEAPNGNRVELAIGPPVAN